MRKLSLTKWIVSLVSSLALLSSWNLYGLDDTGSVATCDKSVLPRLINIASCGVFGDPDLNGKAQFAIKADVSFEISCPGSLAQAGFGDVSSSGGDGRAIHYAAITAISLTDISYDEGSSFIDLNPDINLAASNESDLAALNTGMLDSTLDGLVGTAACSGGKIGKPTKATMGCTGGGDCTLAANASWPNGGDRVELLTTHGDEDRYLLKYTAAGTNAFAAISGAAYADILNASTGVHPAVSFGYNSAGTAVDIATLEGANAVKATVTISANYHADSRNASEVATATHVIGNATGQAW